MQSSKLEFDFVIVGSGAAGATMARDLSAGGKKVLVLEKGADKPLGESLFRLASMANAVKVGENLSTTRAIIAGGSTAMYFAVCEQPDLAVFNQLGIDLSGALAQLQNELPLAIVPDEYLGQQVLRLRENAEALGHEWYKRQMFVDLAKLSGGYNYEAKFKARTFVDQAVQNGATLYTRAEVVKVLTDSGKAVGIQYKQYQNKKNFEVKTVYANKIILAAGATESPLILKRSGVDDVVSRGFYLHPSIVLLGFVPGLKGSNTFGGGLGTSYVDNVGLGDANMNSLLYRLFVMGNGKIAKMFSHRKSMGIGVIARDQLSGGLVDGIRYHKTIANEDLKKLEKAEATARKILERAGAKDIFRSNVSPSHVGGMLHIGEHLDHHFQSQFDNLYVCDGSTIPEQIRIAPTMTLLCMAKYLAGHLLANG